MAMPLTLLGQQSSLAAPSEQLKVLADSARLLPFETRLEQASLEPLRATMRKSKILIVRPQNLVPAFNLISIKTPPIGAAYIASSLRGAGYTVSLLDALGENIDNHFKWGKDCLVFGLNFEDYISYIPDDIDVIAFSLGFSFEWPLYREVINLTKKSHPNAFIIAGGEHATAAPEFTLRETGIHACILGEGEETILDLMRAFEMGVKDFSLVNGIAFIDKDDNFVVTKKRERIRALDEILRPAWDLMPIEEYLSRGYGHGTERGRSMPILASRGCPYQCTFCSNPLMWTTRWNIRSPEDVIDEIENGIKNYQVDNFDFYDLTAIVKKDWIVTFCKLLISKKINITWQLPSGTRSEAIDAEVAKLLYQSGCRNLSYAPESGSERMLKLIKKKIKLDRMLKSISQVKKEGLILKVNIIIGFPQETYYDIFLTTIFSLRMAWAGVYDYSVFTFSPYPGTELFDYLKNKGVVKLDDEFFDSLRSYGDFTKTFSFCEIISSNNLKKIRVVMTALFYLVSFIRFPYRPFKMLKNILNGGNLESRTEKGIYSVLSRFKLIQNQ